MALALLGWALWSAFSPVASPAREIDSAALVSELGDLLAFDGPTHVRVRNAVRPTERDAVAAARRAGARVSWSAAPALGWAAAAAREPGPEGLVRVAIAGVGECAGSGTVEERGRGTVGCGAPGVLLDTLGVVDTLTLRDGGATVTVAPGRGLKLVAPVAQIPLAVAPRDTLPWRVLVLARAGWEAKFAMAALEEHGWMVSARLAVSPGAEVTQGSRSPADGASLSRFSPVREPFDVVLVLDSARVGPDAAAITRFVRSGGGVVLAGEGSAMLASIAPARPGVPSRAPRSDAVVTRQSLPLRPLTDVRADAVVLETRDHITAVAARREGQGRVVQLGYDDTWRWRMQGGETAVVDHRAFWARALASAAAERGVSPDAPEGAPRARLVSAWGPMTAVPARPDGQSKTRWLWPLVALLLVAEWASRRARGAA